MSAPDPESLRALGQRLDELQTKRIAMAKRSSSGQSGIAARIVTELVAGLVVGGGLGWGIDQVLHTAPWGLVVFFMLGAAAGIRGVVRTAQKINADVDAARDVEEK